MKLFYAPGTLALLPHIILLEAGLPFTAIKVDERTKMIEGGGDYRIVNPLGYLPALLLDDGTLITEAAAIVQYIADRAPGKRLAPPNGTIARTQLQAWLNFFASEMHKGAFGPLFYEGVSEDSKKVFRQRLMARYAHVDRHLAGSEYLVGSDFTVADAYLLTISSWAPRVDFDLSPYPNVLAHLERIAARPAVQVAITAQGPLPESSARD
jgi:glutathione S-transferase